MNASHDQMDRVGRTRLAKSCESRDDSLSWNLSRVQQGGAIRADDMDPQDRGLVHVTARLNESGSERPARMRSCNDESNQSQSKATHMDRHENHKWSTARSEANCVNISVMGGSWDKKPEAWVEEMRIVDAEAKSRERVG